jgi:tetratricopeptide (TPR) repeat protein
MADYYMDKARAEQRADRIRTAEVNRQLVNGLGTSAEGDGSDTQDHSTLYRRLFISVVFVLLIMMLMLSTNPAKAQQVIHSGEGEPFQETMLPFTLGRYYFLKGDYEKAVEYFTEAVESLPVEVYEYDATFSGLYLALADAQEAAGLHEEALESYALYIEYSGEEVDLEDIVLEDVEDSTLALVMIDQE